MGGCTVYGYCTKYRPEQHFRPRYARRALAESSDLLNLPCLHNKHIYNQTLRKYLSTPQDLIYKPCFLSAAPSCAKTEKTNPLDFGDIAYHSRPYESYIPHYCFSNTVSAPAYMRFFLLCLAFWGLTFDKTYTIPGKYRADCHDKNLKNLEIYCIWGIVSYPHCNTNLFPSPDSSCMPAGNMV